MLLDKIAEGTWLCGDPGMQYEDTIQRWHTCPNTAPINSSNPCSEYMFIDDSACNLSSINLMKFRREDGGFDVERFRAAVRIFITAQEILVDHASYPTDRIAANSHKFRPLGLGYANLGSLLMASGLPYDSNQGRGLAGAITAIMHGQAYLTQRRARGARGGVRGLRGQPRADAPRDGDASRRGRVDRPLGAGRPARRGPRGLGRVPEHGPRARLSQQPGDRAGADGHDRLHDGLRHHGHRAGHRAGEVQAARRRRDAQDRQPDRADGAGEARLRRAGDPRDPRPHRRPRHDRGVPGAGGRAPAGLRLRVRPAAGGPEHPLPRPPADDGRGAAVPLRGDLQDVQRAQRGDRRGHPRGVPRRLEAGAQGAGDLPRRFQGESTGEHQVGVVQGVDRGRGGHGGGPGVARRRTRRRTAHAPIEPVHAGHRAAPSSAPARRSSRAASGCRTPGAA